MKKRFTFILLGLLLMFGGVSAQTVDLTLNTVAFDASVNNGVVQFLNNQLSYSALGGSSWATTFESGQTHIFTVTLAAASNNTTQTLCLTATTSDVSKYGTPNIVGETATVSVSSNEDGTKKLILSVNANYGAVYLWQSAGEGNGWGHVAIESITREVVSASSVDKPTITAPATYDGDATAVKITPGANNHHVKYSVSGSSSDVSNVQITSETTIYITGSSDVTITATGYNADESESNTNTATVTYSNVIPSGKTTIANNISKVFRSWDDNLQYNNNFQNKVGLNDYVVLGVSDMTKDNAFLGFRDGGNGWSEEPYVSCTTVLRGNGAKGEINKGETQWWLKVSNNDVLSAFSRQVVIQGGVMSDGSTPSPITLNSIDVYKSFAISETENNSITKYNNVVVELTRTFAANTWNTICLPFKPTADQATEMFGEGYKIAKFTSVSGETMQFTKLSSIDAFVAGTPYLVWVTQNEKSSFTFFNVNITARQPQPVGQGDYQFVGLFEKKSFQESEWPTTRFVAAGNKLKTPNSTSALKALRAYFVVPAGSSSAPMLSIDGDGEATGIRSIENGQLTIDNDYYDLSGRRVVKPTKGVYIMNGKKVILK